MIKKCLLAGNVPYVAVLLLCGSAFVLGWLGMHPADAPSSIAIADKSGLILQSVLEHPSLDQAALKKQVVVPVQRVLQAWADKGYVVIDATREDNGRYSVLALPAGARDITADMAAALAASLPNPAKKP